MIEQYDPEELDDSPEQGEARIRYAKSNLGIYRATDRGWESRAEFEFAQTIAKYLQVGVELAKGRDTRTPFGAAFRLDMLLVGPGDQIGIEVDGKEFHKDCQRDELRDAILIRQTAARTIYRFGAAATLFSADNCAYILSRYERRFFDLRARESVLPRLASPWLRAHESLPPDGIFLTPHLEDTAEDPPTLSDEPDPFAHPAYFRVDIRSNKLATTRRTIDWLDRVVAQRGPLPFPKLLDEYRRAREKAV